MDSISPVQDVGQVPQAVRLALVEDNAGFRRQLVELIESQAGWQVVAECSSAQTALARVPAAAPDLVLLDVRLSPGSGVDLVAPLKTALPQVPILMLTVVEQPDIIVRAIRSGASGYLLKRDVPALVQSLREALKEQSPVMSPPIAQRLWQLAKAAEPKPSRTRFRLSPREWEVLVLAARGKQHGEICQELGIAMDTVKNHFRSIYEKTGGHSPIEVLVQLKDGRGLLDDAPHDP